MACRSSSPAATWSPPASAPTSRSISKAWPKQDGKDIGSIARRSSGAWTLTVTARSGHSSGIFSPGSGNGAIYELARIIDSFRSELPEDKLTFNVGLVGGGATAKLDEDRIRLEATGKTNIIPETAVARGDLRALSREQIERVKAKMQAIVADGRWPARRRSSNSTPTNIRRWRRPKAAGRCSPSSTSSTATWAWSRWASWIR